MWEPFWSIFFDWLLRIAGFLAIVYVILMKLFDLMERYPKFQKWYFVVSKWIRLWRFGAREISAEIEGYINEDVYKGLNKSSFGYTIFNKRVKVKWEIKEKETEFPEVQKENEKIVFVFSTDPNKVNNFVIALITYFEEAFLVMERKFIDSDLFDALKIVLMEGILLKRGEEYIKFFRRHILTSDKIRFSI